MTRTLRMPAALGEAARAAAAGRLVVFPTDTVYGVGTNGLLPEAVERIYAAKGRDARKPLPILIKSAVEARRWVTFTPAAEALARAFWPGPLTLVLRPTEEGLRLVLPGFKTLAVRVPAHETSLALLAASGVPWATTSANRSGEPAAADAAAASAALGDAVDWVVDAGRCGGMESSVVDATGDVVRVLREGALSRSRLEAGAVQ